MGVIIRNGRAYTPSQVSTLDELPTVGAQNQLYIVNGSLYFWDSEATTPIFVKANINIDGVTLKEKNGAVCGVGADLSGETININGTNYTASVGATIYNDYSGNKAVGTYSNVFGSNNTSQGNYSTVIGYSNTEKSSYPYGCNTVIGNGNTITSSNSQYNFIEGYQNQLSGSTSCFYNTVMGNNSISGTNIIGNLIFGSHPLNSGSPSIAGNTIEYSLIGGNDNTFAGSSLSQSVILGTLNTVSNGAASYSNFIIGASNNVVLSTNIGCIVAGVGLSFNSTGNEGTTIIGKYNSSSTSYADTLLVVGGGTSNLARTDVLKLSTNGLLQILGPSGNAVTTNGITIESRRTTLSTINTDDASYTTAYLPSNGQELLLSNLYTVGSITITDITNMYYNAGSGDSNKPVSDDYNSVIIFKKGSTMATAEDIMTNFTTQTAVDKIYLLNKDVDISNYTIIHIMLFNDGFNICAIVTGYDDGSANI